ncbi:amidohydrolase family protein [Reyranella sp.]|uniref:amidohydrolase family protein n=1 Tax=Reyranella sp. TaxID=1929291 RepID=UPI003783AE0A
MKTHVRCGTLFSAGDQEARSGQTLVYDARGILEFVGPTEQAPRAAPAEPVLDYSRQFVMPGLIDVHVHLAYGNAKSEEDIDLYSPLEFRALRGLFFAQKLLAAGYTALCSPGDAGQVSLSIRNAIRAGLFDGPRITAAGPYITARQSLTDWYPSWIGAPSTSIGRLVTNRDEAIEEIRVQAKNGVDCVKIALDGIQRRPDGSLIAAFTEDETAAMVREIQRLGRKAVVHAIGREAVLYAARAGVDLIFHAFDLDDECIDAALKGGSAIAPTLTFQRNIIEFTQPHDPAANNGRVGHVQRQYERACRNLAKAHKAGVPMLAGTDSGFAVTPYGEWHARELEIFVNDLGFTPAEALSAATRVNARFLADAERVGTLEPGRSADFIALDGSPLEAISILLDKSRIHAVHLGGKRMTLTERGYDPREVTDKALVNWSDVYTQARVAELRRDTPLRRAAE